MSKFKCDECGSIDIRAFNSLFDSGYIKYFLQCNDCYNIFTKDVRYYGVIT